ncbi:MAG: ribosome-associated translation inhibitor RaiA [Bacteroidales bacterium]|nr:ribosome-associated translation inhibitor RaiA [Bacteroidales bacterium]
MNVTINSVKFDADKKLTDYISNELKKVLKHYDGVIGAEVYLKLDNTSTSENKISEIKLDIPGNELFVKKQSRTFEEATDQAVEALRRMVTKHKEKYRGI